MKKVIYLLIGVLLFFNFSTVDAAEIKEVQLEKCVDGDTAWFLFKGEKIKARFLAINTPESTTKKEPFGKEASEYVCGLLTNANTIKIEYDDKSDKLDKYDRHLVWVFVDNELVQEKVLKEGLAEIKYIYGDYKYLDISKQAEKIAKDKKLNIWSEYEEEKPNYLLIGISSFGALIIYLVFSKSKSKSGKKIKKSAKKSLDKSINKFLK